MKKSKFLFHNYSWVFFSTFFLLALIAFWPGYFAKLDKQEHFRFHTHGLAMTLWCLMLIGQSFMIRFKYYKIHGFIGKLSYLVFPLIIVATINLIHFGFSDLVNLASVHLSSIALMVNATFVLALFYGFAIYFRKSPFIHARFMVATVFPMITPVTDRLIYRQARWILEYVPTIDGFPIAPAAGFLLGDLIICGLIFWDGFMNKQWKVFPFVLIVMLCYHSSVLFWYDSEYWRAFSNWFLSLPLS